MTRAHLAHRDGCRRSTASGRAAGLTHRVSCVDLKPGSFSSGGIFVSVYPLVRHGLTSRTARRLPGRSTQIACPGRRRVASSNDRIAAQLLVTLPAAARRSIGRILPRWTSLPRRDQATSGKARCERALVKDHRERDEPGMASFEQRNRVNSAPPGSESRWDAHPFEIRYDGELFETRYGQCSVQGGPSEWHASASALLYHAPWGRHRTSRVPTRRGASSSRPGFARSWRSNAAAATPSANGTERRAPARHGRETGSRAARPGSRRDRGTRGEPADRSRAMPRASLQMPPKGRAGRRRSRRPGRVGAARRALAIRIDDGTDRNRRHRRSHRQARTRIATGRSLRPLAPPRVALGVAAGPVFAGAEVRDRRMGEVTGRCGSSWPGSRRTGLEPRPPRPTGGTLIRRAHVRPHRPAADARGGRGVRRTTPPPTPSSRSSTGCSRRPHFGERWGRHWLDLVRYAETTGHECEHTRSRNAWRYRDYVIRAFNADVPYDQFVREHIAGDLLAAAAAAPATRRQRVDPRHRLLVLGDRGQARRSTSRQAQADRIDNQIDVIGKTFLGLTVACARCHDHKFDADPARGTTTRLSAT